MTKIAMMPVLWFHVSDGETDPVTNYCNCLFWISLNIEAGIPLGGTAEGMNEMWDLSLFEHRILSGTVVRKRHKFKDSFACRIFFRDQQEIDPHRSYHTTAGAESRCGLFFDKFSLPWKAIPQDMGISKAGSMHLVHCQTKQE